MALMDDVKARFPLWDEYCLDSNDVAQDSVLQIDMDRALALMQEYITTLDATNLTDPLEEHFINIVKKVAFNRKHLDAEFENTPQVIKDYDRALKMLQRYKEGEFTFDATPSDSTDDIKSIRLQTKTRRFDTWFTDEE